MESNVYIVSANIERTPFVSQTTETPDCRPLLECPVLEDVVLCELVDEPLPPCVPSVYEQLQHPCLN